jgi:hypothetical protein
MKNKKYVITTDYKSGGLFSAVFSFECDSDTFRKMDKTDLLHSYLVSQVILSFNDEDYETDFSQPYILSDTVETVKNVVNSVKRQAGGKRFDERLSQTLTAIEEQFPEETKEIKQLVEDKTKIVCTSFFVPQILNSLIQEYELSESKKSKYLVSINLHEFVNTSPGIGQAIAIDFFSSFKEGSGKLNLGLKNKKKLESLLETIKQTLQLNMISNGEFPKYLEQREAKHNNTQIDDNQTQEGQTPQE